MLYGIGALFVVAIIVGVFTYMATHNSPHARH